MSYILYKLDDAKIVEEAIEIVKPVLSGNYNMGEIETNSVGSVIFTCFAHGNLHGLYRLYDAAKGLQSEQKCKITVNFEVGITITFYSILSTKNDIVIQIRKNDDKNFECVI